MLHKLTRPARIPGLGLGHVCQVIPTLFQLSLTVQWLQVFTTAKLSELTAIQLMAPASSPGLRLLATLAPWNSPDTGLYPSHLICNCRRCAAQLRGLRGFQTFGGSIHPLRSPLALDLPRLNLRTEAVRVGGHWHQPYSWHASVV